MWGMRWNSLNDGYGGDPGLVWTTEVNFAPSFTVAQVGLSMAIGDGTQCVGIAGIRWRPEPNGAEESQTFGNWWEWPGMYGRGSMTSVTVGMVLGSDQSASGFYSLYFW